MAKGASKTGAQPGFLVASEMLLPEEQRILSDEWAGRMLPGAMKAMMPLMRREGFRDWMVRASEDSISGAWAGILIRKRYIDDRLREALPGMRAVVNLGAGMDTRALRMPELRGFPIWELDQPTNIADKRARFERVLGRVPDNLHLAPIDFDTDDTLGALIASGYDPSWVTFFIWEGVTQYVTEPGILATLKFLSGVPKGSKLAFTYVVRDFLEGKDMMRSEKAHARFVVKQKMWVWGKNPDEWPALLEKHGWRLIEDVTATQLAEKYIAPTRRDLATSGLERMALAVRI